MKKTILSKANRTARLEWWKKHKKQIQEREKVCFSDETRMDQAEALNATNPNFLANYPRYPAG